MILLDKENNVFTLHTQNTTYQMKADQHSVLVHTYYGPRVAGGDLSYLVRYADRACAPNPSEAGLDRTYSLNTIPQEYSTCGVGDFRLPSIELELPCGSRSADLRYAGCQLRRGKYALEGLPAFRGSEEEAETLVLLLEDAAAQVRVELYYGVFEPLDLITRAVRVVNFGEGPIRLRQCASLCLDFLRSDLDLITFNGCHLMERSPDRAPLRSGVQGVDSIRGASSHQHNPFVVLCDHDAKEDYGLCYGALLLYSGNFQISAEGSQYDNTRLVMGINRYQFCWTLEPGQSFTAPEGALVCSPSGLGQMSRQYHRAIRHHLIDDPCAGERRPVLINNWEATYFNFDAQCEGANLASVSYRIDNENAFFEYFDWREVDKLREAGDDPQQVVEHGPSFTLTYGSDGTAATAFTRLYVISPCPDEYARNPHAVEGYAEAARVLDGSTITLTATFNDGTTQERAYRIAMAESFDEKCREFLDEYFAAWDIVGRQGKEAILDETSDAPKLFTLESIDA